MNMSKPNIVLIYPDQMRYDALSFTGNSVCKTPNIDDLVQESVNFSESYTSFPLCCPFRASLMTGKYAHKTGMLCNHYAIPLNQEFLPNMVKPEGYRSAWIGKWHLDGGKKFDPVPKEYQLGFDEFVGYSRGHKYLNSVYYRGENPTPYKSEKFEPVYQTDQLLDFIERAADDEVPFLGMLCYGLPHPPVNDQPDHYKYMYSPDDITLPPTVPPQCEQRAREFLAMYYGMVTCVDEQVGRIISRLKEKDLWNNTLFILVSDHGDMGFEFGLSDKKLAYRSSAHVPMIIHYPGQAACASVDQIVDPSVAVTPTILDYCGVPVPDFMPGKSLKKVMESGADETLDDYAYFQMPKTSPETDRILELLTDQKPFPERGFRTKDYLYVEKCGAPFQLFDLKNDPYEQYNCVDNSKYLDIVRAHRKRLYEIMEKLDDSWDVEMKDFPETYQRWNEGPAYYQEVFAKAVYEE